MNAAFMLRGRLGVAALISALAAPLSAQEGQGSAADLILGAWKTTDRHLSLGSLYQPVHAVRTRGAELTFQMHDGKLRAHAFVPNFKEIVRQTGWDGRREISASFADGRLKMEWEIREWFTGEGPLAVEEHRTPNKGMIRVEAVLKDQRLIGTWKMLLSDGTEVFRGEWEAVRNAEKKPQP